MSHIIKKINPVIIIAIILFIIPFFWFTPGAMDLGGDGTRLYFYDPLSYIKIAFYGLDPFGKGEINSGVHGYLVYASLLWLIKQIVVSPHLLISIFNGIKLSVGFVSIYFIVKEFIQEGKSQDKRVLSAEFSAILAGIFYILATGSEKLIFFWVKALQSHDQIFLNPLMFFFLLRYLLTRNKYYLYGSLFIAFIFSTNFSLMSSPAFFSFYPLAIIFLIVYVVFVRKIKIILADVFLGIMLLLGTQAYHLIPEVSSLFDPANVINAAILKDPINSGVNFFVAVRGEGKISLSLLMPSPILVFRWTSFIVPFVVIFGFLLLKKKRKEIILTSFFFLITLFLVSANITNIGLEFYKRLFYIPGFSMFRHFFYQWAYVFIFFYALVFGQCLYVIFSRLKDAYIKLTAVIILIIFIIGFWAFLNGSLIDAVQWGSNNVKTAMIMDSRYEQTLQFIRKLPNEGKILILPLTDNFNQVVYGTNNAAYVGPSSISYLTHKKSFAGYQNFWPNPIPETIMRFSREKNYMALTQIFSFFNIRYILHNTDPKIYEEKFPQFPNSYMMTSLPKTQEEYKEFVKKFPVRSLYKNGPFNIFEFDEKVYRPEVYIPDSIYEDDMVHVISNQKVSYQSAFIEKAICQKSKFILAFCNQPYIPSKADITITKNNPNDYIISIKQTQSELPTLLVFQNAYNASWKLLLANEQPIHEDKHLLVNKYANAWLITKEDRQGKAAYVLHLVLQTQKYFSYGLGITFITLLIFFSFVIREFIKKKNV